jgi:hypothetical protein
MSKSLFSPVAPSKLASLSKDAQLLAQEASGGMGVSAWGSRVAPTARSTWDQLNPGDWVLFYSQKRFVSAARVLIKEESGKTAGEIWGDPEWGLVSLFDRVIDLDLPREIVLGMLAYDTEWAPRGFVRCDRQALLAENFGGVPQFIAALRWGSEIDHATEVLGADGADTSASSVAASDALDEIADVCGQEVLSSILASAGAAPEQSEKIVKTFVRNKHLAQDIKDLYEGRCQLCGFTFPKRSTGEGYSEAAHLTALHEGGEDGRDNIVSLCANHHKMLDFGPLVIEFREGALKSNVDPASGELLSPGNWVTIENLHIGRRP